MARKTRKGALPVKAETAKIPASAAVTGSEAREVVRAWSARGPVALGFVALIVLLGGFGTWSVMSSIASAIVAPGAIEVEQNRQVVQHPDGGVVREILVKEGDMVEAGEVLIRLDPERLQTELTIVESQLFELMARRARLEAERDGTEVPEFDEDLIMAAEANEDVADMLQSNRGLFIQRRDNLAASIEQLGKRKNQINSQIEGIGAQLDALSEQTRLIDEELKNQLILLEKNLTQASEVLGLQREAARLQGTIGEITAARAQGEGRITEIEIEILRVDAERREEATTALSEQEGRELEMAERQRALIEQLDRLDIRAPVGGAIHAMQVFAERSVVRPADPVMFVVPQDRPLLIGVRVDPIHVDQTHVGQEVFLRFAAFDGRTTPELLGQVLTISPDALVDENTGMSFYRARIQLREGELEKLPEGLVLIPGMPVEAFLRTGDQSPIAYLVRPFADYFNRAFREN